jgi:hypothetical protein
MRRLLTLVYLAAVAVPAAAQDTPRPARAPRPTRDSSVARTYRLDVGPEGLMYQVGRRGRLGVLVELGPDSVGALITGVTPGSAADKAGVQTGDVVVQFNGARLARAGSGGDDDADASPGNRLVELASRLHTGDTVHLEVRREGRPLNLTVIAGQSGMESMVRSLTLQPARRPLMVQPFGDGQMSLMFDGAPLANLELVKVNPGLGEYFGTSEGILVVNAPGDSSLGLRAGDVILSIGGRKPTGPSHAFRILGTYDAGETVTFDVMRMKRHVAVNGKMPEQSGWKFRHNSFDENELMQPGWEHMDLLRGWSGMELPRMRWEPEMQPLRELPQQMIKLHLKHRAVET